LFLCILYVYLGVPYAFFNKIFLTYKKKVYNMKHLTRKGKKSKKISKADG